MASKVRGTASRGARFGSFGNVRLRPILSPPFRHFNSCFCKAAESVHHSGQLDSANSSASLGKIQSAICVCRSVFSFYVCCVFGKPKGNLTHKKLMTRVRALHVKRPGGSPACELAGLSGQKPQKYTRETSRRQTRLGVLLFPRWDPLFFVAFVLVSKSMGTNSKESRQINFTPGFSGTHFNESNRPLVMRTTGERRIGEYLHLLGHLACLLLLLLLFLLLCFFSSTKPCHPKQLWTAMCVGVKDARPGFFLSGFQIGVSQ